MALDLVLLEQIRNNEVVDLGIGGKLSIEEIVLLATALSQCKDLRSVNLYVNKIGDKEIGILAGAFSQCPKLQSIDLENNEIGDVGTKALAEVLPKLLNLRNLDLRGNRIGVEGIKILAAILYQCSIQSINLNDNNIGDEGAKDLAIGFSRCSNLQKIDLAKNKMGYEGVKDLAIGFSQCSNLHSIDLAWNNMGDKEAKALAQILPQCPKLQNLDLTFNHIGDEGAIALAQILPQCVNLYFLEVHWNKISDKGAMAILSAIQENQYITDCKVMFAGPNQDKIDRICEANQERIQNIYQVTALDEELQEEEFYEKLYACPGLTRAIEDKVIPVATVHTSLKGKSIEEINLLDIRDQSISEMLKEHYINPALSDQRPQFLAMLVEKNFYGYDAIPTIIECGHFAFAQDLIESSEITSCGKYFTSLIDAAPDPSQLSEYCLLSHVILSRIHDLRSNPYYMQEAIDKRKSTLVQSLIEHHASSEGVTTHQLTEDLNIPDLADEEGATPQCGFSEDDVIFALVEEYNSAHAQEQLATMTGELSLVAENL